MNVSLLTDVKFNILAVPETFDMDNWFQSSHQSPCKTAGCIAGHTVAIARNFTTLRDARNNVCDWTFASETKDIAAEALGLTEGQVSRLFFVHGWPEKYCTQYRNAATAEQRAQTTADRIDHFIAANGAE